MVARALLMRTYHEHVALTRRLEAVFSLSAHALKMICPVHPSLRGPPTQVQHEIMIMRGLSQLAQPTCSQL